jgi:DNA-binding MarR family transcriptional regulator
MARKSRETSGYKTAFAAWMVGRVRQGRVRIDAVLENVSQPAAMTENHNMIGALGPLVGYRIRRAFGAFAVDFADALEGTGMRQVLVGILSVVSENPGIHQGAVGRVLGIKRANMVSLINELVEAGLLTRVVDRADRRAVALEVTNSGRALLADCLARIDMHEKRMLAGFTETEKATLLDLLGRIERREPPLSER